jgi:hypothetical protein
VAKQATVSPPLSSTCCLSSLHLETMGPGLALPLGVDDCFAAVERLATTPGSQLGTAGPASGRRLVLAHAGSVDRRMWDEQSGVFA